MDIKQSFQLVVLFLACCFPFMILWIHKLQSIHSEVIKEANDTIDLLNLELRVVEAELTAEKNGHDHTHSLLMAGEFKFDELRADLEDTKTDLACEKMAAADMLAEYRNLQHELVARAYEIDQLQYHGACRDGAASYEISSLKTRLTGLNTEYNSLLADYDKLWGYQVSESGEPVDHSDGLEDKYDPPFPYQDGGEDICF